MQEAVQDPATHRYPAYSGMTLFREAVARWYRQRFGVELDPESEVLTLIGSKEGIAHLPLGINDPEDINLMTTPGYPVYQMGTLFAGGFCHFLPLTRENNFLPDLEHVRPWSPGTPRPCSSTIPTTPRPRWRTRLFLPGWWLSAGSMRSSRCTTRPTPSWPMTAISPPVSWRCPGPRRSASSSIPSPRPTT